MKPCYRGFQDIMEFYTKYGVDSRIKPSKEEIAARKELGMLHNHTCWLNPIGGFNSKRTKKLCKKFCKKHNIPKEPYYKKNYDCDMCPNCITYYKNGDDFLFALGNSYLYEKQGKIK